MDKHQETENLVYTTPKAEDSGSDGGSGKNIR